MTSTVLRFSKVLVFSALASVLAGNAATAPNFVTGVVLIRPTGASLDYQNDVISQLKSSGVKVIRLGLTLEDKDIDFAKRLYAQGIKIDLLVGPQYPPGAPKRVYNYKEFPNMWSSNALSGADPDLSKTYFQSLLSKLEAQGVVLEALELGNEYNWAPFNADFQVPGEGKNFSLDDLNHDPEAQQVAKGLLRYLKVLAALKDVRDHSQLNGHTPIISVGLADDGPAGPWHNSKVSGLNLNAAIEFMRANGLDSLVDAYGIHTYPSQNGTPSSRRANLEKNAVAECHAAGSKSGKPCWITEWGFENKDVSCPLNDSGRAELVKEMMGDFRDLAQQGRLAGVLYFVWNQDPTAKSVDTKSVWRCGGLTESGKLALVP